MARHDVELAVFFAKPDGRGNADTRFAECGQRDVFLSLNRGRNLTCHGVIVAASIAGSCQSLTSPADGDGSQVPLWIALNLQSVLQA